MSTSIHPDIARIRTVALVGLTAAGKTTLAEALLQHGRRDQRARQRRARHHRLRLRPAGEARASIRSTPPWCT